eukprot:CAMPEP_0119142462 /NCGR_PEP_ID=MMETSP1310-20130426/32682_1 /TAXON_ID=464262 /ORGANISM="Genus nov. species nov., Strain RCC2339" /LENGTH=171 /DNA_ID=CAMNT_0007134003 /DNA_START=169 /DNA_END=680 /DNA_ORIENTATION=+
MAMDAIEVEAIVVTAILVVVISLLLSAGGVLYRAQAWTHYSMTKLDTLQERIGNAMEIEGEGLSGEPGVGYGSDVDEPDSQDLDPFIKRALESDWLRSCPPELLHSVVSDFESTVGLLEEGDDRVRMTCSRTLLTKLLERNSWWANFSNNEKEDWNLYRQTLAECQSESWR